jgi:hypothetical protein
MTRVKVGQPGQPLLQLRLLQHSDFKVSIDPLHGTLQRPLGNLNPLKCTYLNVLYIGKPSGIASP